MTIDISHLDKREVLRRLYNAARPQGLGFLKITTEDMSLQEAAELLEEDRYFDYVHGRVMKVDIRGDKLNPTLYDRDNGLGAAVRALSGLVVVGRRR